MSRLTLRLPETLHQQLTHLADSEGVSLNQYIVYALTRQATSTYSVQVVSPETIASAKESFESLLLELGQVSPKQIASILAERDVVAPEAELSSEAIDFLQQQIHSQLD
jgi:uncharacterized protein (DUF1778 family)